MKHLKKTPPQVDPYLIDQVEAGKLAELDVLVGYGCELDEFWSYVAGLPIRRIYTDWGPG